MARACGEANILAATLHSIADRAKKLRGAEAGIQRNGARAHSFFFLLAPCSFSRYPIPVTKPQ